MFSAKRTLSLLLALLLIFALAMPAFADEEDEGLTLQSSEEYYRQFEGTSINVYNWGEYISDGSDDLIDVNRAFQEATGIRVNYTTFATNEELYSKLRSGNANYDVIIPSDYMISRMITEDMLLPLDYGSVPNFENIEEDFLNPLYDPENRYTVPYTWGVVGIIYNTTLFYEEEITSWSVLWDEKYFGNILMFSNPRDAFGIAQAYLGYSTNTTDERELMECFELLQAQKPMVQAYVMDEIFDKMLGGEAALAPYYAGDAITMMDENEDLDFVVPEEGTNIFVDAACIPAGAKNPGGAHLYINFLLEPEIAAANAEFIGYAIPNAPAKELLDEEITENPIAYPPEEVIENAEYFLELPRETSLLVDRLWTDLLSSDEQYSRMAVPVMLMLAILLSLGINIYRYIRKNRKPIF